MRQAGGPRASFSCQPSSFSNIQPLCYVVNGILTEGLIALARNETDMRRCKYVFQASKRVVLPLERFGPRDVLTSRALPAPGDRPERPGLREGPGVRLDFGTVQRDRRAWNWA